MIFINTGAWFAAVVPTDPASTFSFQLSAFSFDLRTPRTLAALLPVFHFQFSAFSFQF